ncbi:hypothetical protein [Streptomyces sp. NPDC002122]|uniref:hypothetical protein n=1 Tax=Streptomyces sp. NPDC002122 TaxID=3154407 RepID=UPI00331DCF9A
MTTPADEPKAAVEAGQRRVIVCYAWCEPCQWGQCYDKPTPHGWAGSEDIEHARAMGQPEPTGNCACPCATTGDA